MKKLCVNCRFCVTHRNDAPLNEPECWHPDADDARDPVNGDWPTCRRMRVTKALLYGHPITEEGFASCGDRGEWFAKRGAAEKAEV